MRIELYDFIIRQSILNSQGRHTWLIQFDISLLFQHYIHIYI